MTIRNSLAMPSAFYPVAVLSLLSLTGCAAPIKAFLNAPPEPLVERASLHAADEREVRMRSALLEKGRALVEARAQSAGKPTGPTSSSQAALPTRTSPAGGGASANVSAMLARAKSAELPRTPPAVLEPAGLANQIRVKDETRLGDSPEGSQSRRPDQVVIRFEPGVTTLDAAGNRALAELAHRSGLSPSATIVLVAGLSGRGTPWERMQMASDRLETVARHIPPPLRVTRKFEVELEGQQMRLELHHEVR